MDEPTPASAFTQAACPQQPETLLLDTDVLDWIKADYADWQGHINHLLRFYYETSQIREADFHPDAFEPGEMAQLDPPPGPA